MPPRTNSPRPQPLIIFKNEVFYMFFYIHTPTKNEKYRLAKLGSHLIPVKRFICTCQEVLTYLSRGPYLPIKRFIWTSQEVHTYLSRGPCIPIKWFLNTQQEVHSSLLRGPYIWGLYIFIYWFIRISQEADTHPSRGTYFPVKKFLQYPWGSPHDPLVESSRSTWEGLKILLGGFQDPLSGPLRSS